MRRQAADIVGRYHYLTVEGVEYRVYVEEAGSGVPVVLQHTAGCDGRQWRHLLEDPSIAGEFRLIAADLPYHGKSLPPTDVAWWEQEYILTEEFLLAFHVELADVLGLDRPIYVGCSMGGHLAADIALQHPDRYRAGDRIEAALHSHGMERILPYLNHPEINNEQKAGLMLTLCSPSSPEQSVRETGWIYTQGAPGVFKGDLEYYMVEHDLSEKARLIDTSRVAMWILSGEYDWTAPPTAGQLLANEIEGSHFVVMEGLGHFPMAEHPERFKDFIIPILREAAALERADLAPA